MSGYTKSPNEVVFNLELSIGARLAHTGLLHLAWRNGRKRAGEPVHLPALEEIARMLGVSRTAFRGYLKELRDARFVYTKRTRQSMTYVVFQQAATDEEIADLKGRIPPFSNAGKRADSALPRARAILASSEDRLGPYGSSPPPLVLVGGRNLGFDALADVCGIDERSNRVRLIPVALHSKGKTAGIRELFWEEARRWAAEHGATDRLESIAGTEEFEKALAQAIRRKASQYQLAMPRATLTPTALREWWLDLERQRPPGDGMTPQEIASFREETDGR